MASNDSSGTKPLDQDGIITWQGVLEDVRLSLKQLKETGSGDESLSKRLSALQEQLTNLEQKLAVQALEQDELTALYDVSQAIGSTLDLQEVLNRVMDQITRLTGAERAILMLYDPEADDLVFRAGRNLDRETIDSTSFEISRSVVNQVSESGEPIVTTNAQMDPRFKTQESVIGYNLRSILCVPLKVRGRVTGAIYADNRIRIGIFSERDRDLLAAFASQAAVAIENARLFENIANAKTLMDNIFASITSGVITTDVDEQITLFNRAAEQILDVPADVVEGKYFGSAVPELADALHPAIERVEREETPVVGFEKEISFPTRERVDLRTSLSPLKNANEKMQGIAIVLDDLTEQRRLEAREELFHRYLPPAVIERLPTDPKELKLGGQRQRITSLFADIRGFTNFSRQHDPETLVNVLNQYLAVGAEAVLSEEGTLDKIMGDCVVAFFNAPLPQPDHTRRAVRAALKIQQGITELHKRLPPALRLFYGVGIGVGEAVVGNVGTSQQMNYTAIGSIVNLANALQESAPPGKILLTDEAYHEVEDYVEVRPVSPEELKEDLDEPVQVYGLLKLL